MVDTTPGSDAPTSTPATNPPTTDPPTTEAPPTDPPTTDAPTSDPPTSDPPTSDLPTSDPATPALGDPAAIVRIPLVDLLDRLPLAVLDERPADNSYIEVHLADLDAASALAGLDRPDPSDLEASADWLVALSRTGLLGPLPLTAGPRGGWLRGGAEDLRDEFGYSPYAIDAFAATFGTGASLDVLSGTLTLSADLIDLGGGIVSAGEGDDFTNGLETRNEARPNGVPVRLTTRDGLVAASRSTSVVENWAAGGWVTLRADPSIAAAAVALDTVGVVGAEIYAADFTSIVDSADSGPAPISVPFAVVGIGVTVIDGAATSAIAYVFADETAAASALAEIDGRWRGDELIYSGDRMVSDVYGLRSVEQLGSAVLVTATPVEPGQTSTAREMLLRSEPLLTHR